MKNENLVGLPLVNSFEEYEKLKENIEIFTNAAQQIIHRHRLPMELPLTIFSEGTNIVFSHGQQSVIKIFPPFHQDQFKAEVLVLKHLQGRLSSVRTPRVEHTGDISGWPYIVMTKLRGTLLEELWDNMEYNNKIIIMQELGLLIHKVHSIPADGLEEIDSHWPQFITTQINVCEEKHRLALSGFLEQIPVYLKSITKSLIENNKLVILTGEYTPMNILVEQVESNWHITGLIDFGDSMLGPPEYDLLGPGAFLIQGDKHLRKEFLLAYGYSENELDPLLSHQLTALTLLHKYSNLNVQIRIKDWKNKVHNLNDLEKLIWGF